MTLKEQSLWRKRRTAAVVIAVVATSVAVFGFVHYSRHSPSVSTVEVKRGEFLDAIQFRGELKAMKTVTTSAPSDAGDLQILKMATDGSRLNQGDMIVEFDPSKNQQDLANDRSILKSAQAEIEQVRAQNRLTEEADATDVTKARYEVELAKLEASKGEIVSKIEGSEAALKLNDAEQALREAETKLSSDRAADQAAVESKKNASDKAAFDAQRAEHALASMTLKVPSSGTISLIPIWHDGGVSPFKPGDRAWPGAPIAELPDASSLRIVARVDETERGRLALMQPVKIQLDAISDRQFTGKLARIGTLASSDFSAGWPIPRNFDLEITLDQSDQRLKPGMTVQIAVIVDRVPDAVTIPAQALFLKSGQNVAFVWDGSAFRQRVIQVERRSRDRILISNGLQPGDLVALKDPLVKE
jgi:RND family efflux transporter MFP subunit